MLAAVGVMTGLEAKSNKQTEKRNYLGLSFGPHPSRDRPQAIHSTESGDSTVGAK